MENQTVFVQMDRIRLVAGKRTPAELAEFFDTRQSAVSDAVALGKIPSSWPVVLMRVKNVYPERVLTGNGPCYAALPRPPDAMRPGGRVRRAKGG